jgi:hypothetical protein
MIVTEDPVFKKPEVFNFKFSKFAEKNKKKTRSIRHPG